MFVTQQFPIKERISDPACLSPTQVLFFLVFMGLKKKTTKKHMSYISLPELQEIHSKLHASSSSKGFLGLFSQQQEEQNNLGSRPCYKYFPQLPGMEWISCHKPVCIGRVRRGRKQEDELAKNWHNVRGLCLPPKPLKGFAF